MKFIACILCIWFITVKYEEHAGEKLPSHRTLSILVLKYSFFRKITIIFKVWPQEIPLQLSHLLSSVFTLGSLKLLVLKCTLFKPVFTAFGELGIVFFLTQTWLLPRFMIGDTYSKLLNNVWSKRYLNTDGHASNVCLLPPDFPSIPPTPGNTAPRFTAC